MVSALDGGSLENLEGMKVKDQEVVTTVLHPVLEAAGAARKQRRNSLNL